MLLAKLAATSERVGQTSKRTEKLKLLSACIAQAGPDTRGLTALYLSGVVRPSKLG